MIVLLFKGMSFISWFMKSMGFEESGFRVLRLRLMGHNHITTQLYLDILTSLCLAV